jgi:hypothetical protein
VDICKDRIQQFRKSEKRQSGGGRDVATEKIKDDTHLDRESPSLGMPLRAECIERTWRAEGRLNAVVCTQCVLLDIASMLITNF